jgi:hypothetical protein
VRGVGFWGEVMLMESVISGGIGVNFRWEMALMVKLAVVSGGWGDFWGRVSF